MGAFSRDKGARAERELCAMLRDNLGGDYCRNLKQYQKSQEGDIEQLVGPYLIECKSHAILSLNTWWHQIGTAAAKHPLKPLPCLAYKVARARKPLDWRFVVPLLREGVPWRDDLQFTQTLFPAGFFFIVREHG